MNTVSEPAKAAMNAVFLYTLTCVPVPRKIIDGWKISSGTTCGSVRGVGQNGASENCFADHRTPQHTRARYVRQCKSGRNPDLLGCSPTSVRQVEAMNETVTVAASRKHVERRDRSFTSFSSSSRSWDCMDDDTLGAYLFVMQMIGTGNIAALREALGNGFRTDFVDVGCETPMHAAATSGSARMCEILFAQGARVDARDSGGRTPADVAQVFNNHVLAGMLKLMEGIEQQRDRERNLQLKQAASFGDATRTRELLLQGADVAFRDYGGRTALHVACASGHAAVAKVLLQHGAGIWDADRNGWTAVDWARESAHRDLANAIECWSRESAGNSLDL